MYITKFDEAGKPSGFLRPGINISADDVAAKIAEGYVEISDDEWSYYVGNQGNGDNGTGYVRDSSTGKPISAPARVITLAEAQSTALKSVDTEADAAYVGGFQSLATGTALYYDSDRDTQDEIRSASVLAACNPTQFAASFADGFPIRGRATKDAEKQKCFLTAAQTIELGNDWTARMKEIKSQVWSLQSKINACTTVADVEAITITIS